jgi:hypothetical protein
VTADVLAAKRTGFFLMDEHFFESEHAIQERYSLVNSKLSKFDDVFVKNLHLAKIQATEHNMTHDTND